MTATNIDCTLQFPESKARTDGYLQHGPLSIKIIALWNNFRQDIKEKLESPPLKYRLNEKSKEKCFHSHDITQKVINCIPFKAVFSALLTTTQTQKHCSHNKIQSDKQKSQFFSQWHTILLLLNTYESHPNMHTQINIMQLPLFVCFFFK